jgi:flavorubredoxin
MNISDSIRSISVNDHLVDLFEGQYPVPKGMTYNSYVILDEKVAVLNTVDQGFTGSWLEALQNSLQGRTPDYLIVQHMEPDHSAGIAAFLEQYPGTTLVASAPAFTMMANYFGTNYADNRVICKEGSTLSLGSHTLTFLAAPMVHWPEVMVVYDDFDQVLFSADAFGSFGALDAQDFWDDEARRYYIGIVGQFGVQVQALLKKVASLELRHICPLHGPVLSENLGHYVSLYDTWSSYRPEAEGVVIAYTSVYGHTRAAAEALALSLREKGCETRLYDLARCDSSQAVADAFRFSTLVLATTTYNGDMFPTMQAFLLHLTERHFQNRRIALIENGSWAPLAAKAMKAALEGCKELRFASQAVKIKATLNPDSTAHLEALAQELTSAE